MRMMRFWVAVPAQLWRNIARNARPWPIWTCWSDRTSLSPATRHARPWAGLRASCATPKKPSSDSLVLRPWTSLARPWTRPTKKWIGALGKARLLRGPMPTQIAPNPLPSDLHWYLQQARARRLRMMRQFAEEEIIIPGGPFDGRRFRCSRQPFAGLWFDEVDSGR